MSRTKISEKMIKYLEDRINCENVIRFTEKTLESELGKGKEAVVNKLVIDGTPVAYKVIKYNNSDDYVRKKGEMRDKKWAKNMFEIFDFMTEANYTGFEYFPYLYGVLICHNDETNISTMYIFYEVFDGDLTDLFNKIEHPSDWYDIIFQLIMINYYITFVHGYIYYDGSPQNHLYKKLPKPYYKDYEIEGHKFKINHKYLLALWDFNYMEKLTEESKERIQSNIDLLLKYIQSNKHKGQIKNPPSDRILKLLNEVKDNPENTISILDTYYNIK